MTRTESRAQKGAPPKAPLPPLDQRRGVTGSQVRERQSCPCPKLPVSFGTHGQVATVIPTRDKSGVCRARLGTMWKVRSSGVCVPRAGEGTSHLMGLGLAKSLTSFSMFTKPSTGSYFPRAGKSGLGMGRKARVRGEVHFSWRRPEETCKNG